MRCIRRVLEVWLRVLVVHRRVHVLVFSAYLKAIGNASSLYLYSAVPGKSSFVKVVFTLCSARKEFLRFGYGVVWRSSSKNCT